MTHGLVVPHLRMLVMIRQQMMLTWERNIIQGLIGILERPDHLAAPAVATIALATRMMSSTACVDHLKMKDL